MAEKALGMIEVRGFLGAISVADAALKAANVTLANADVIRGGYTTIELTGDVAAVRAAVDAGVQIGEQLGSLMSRHVIARLDVQAEGMLSKESKAAEKTENHLIEEVMIEETPDGIVEEIMIIEPKSESQLKKMELKELREYAHQMGLKNLSTKEINMATKNRLIKAILKEM